MWLQKVLYTVEKTLFGRDDDNETAVCRANNHERPASDRAQSVERRLMELDKRLDLLR